MPWIETEETCIVCRGSKGWWVGPWSDMPDPPQHTTWVVCMACHGSGKVPGRPKWVENKKEDKDNEK